MKEMSFKHGVKDRYERVILEVKLCRFSNKNVKRSQTDRASSSAVDFGDRFLLFLN